MRLTVPRVLAVAAATSLTAYVFVYGPREAAVEATSTTRPQHQSAPVRVTRHLGVFPPTGKKFIGIMTTDGPYNFTSADNFSSAVGFTPQVYEFSQGWGVNRFDRGTIDAVATRGMLPVISWEPWNYQKVPKQDRLRGYQPAYRLANIIDGHYDHYIRSWAVGIKSLGYTVAIRFAHEMNGYWYPWGVANGNKTGQYVAAWRHVHDIFAQVGARNVIWVWSPNILWNNSPNLRQFYPGNNYVNWIGLSGYYGTPGMYAYKTFDQVFAPTVHDLRTFTNKPIVITETGATDVSGEAPRWIKTMFRQLPSRSGIIGVIWYEGFNVVDWKVTSDPASVAAFRAGVRRAVFQFRWVPGMTPLLQVSGSPPASASILRQ